jgi:glucosamine--fructose-6-phosphate aminotransferase (isomerizing)
MARQCSHVVIAARGSSDNAARYAQYAWGSRNGLTVSLATPSLYTLYERPPHLDGALVVGVSQSGQSPDIVSVLVEARRQGRPTVSITNEPESPLAGAAGIVVPLHAGEETAIAATKTYTAQLATIAMLSDAMAGDPGQVDRLPHLVAEALGQEDRAKEEARRLGAVEHAAVLGRGFNLATVFEWALKLQELAYVVAQPFSTADFLHGPVAVVDRGYPVLAVVSAGPTADDVLAAVERAEERGAPALIVTNSANAGATAHRLVFPEVDDWLSPIPAMVPAQLLSYWLSVALGHDPDTPRGLEKVTRTV